MNNPRHNENRTSREFTDAFYGYDCRRRIAQGYWNYTENLSTEEFPLLSRRKLKTCAALPNNPLGLLGGDVIAYVDTNRADESPRGANLFYGFPHFDEHGVPDDSTNASKGNAIGILDWTTKKQLVRMGAWICIFPDKKAYNTATGEWKTFEAHYGGDFINPGGLEAPYTYEMCHVDGTVYTEATRSEEEPESKTGLWIEVDSEGNYKATLQYSESSGKWVNLNTVYTRINFNTKGVIPKLFKANDVVNFKQLVVPTSPIIEEHYTTKWENKRIVALGGSSENAINDYIVVIEPMSSLHYNPGPNVGASDKPRVVIERLAPDLDFVCECQNRLWGCRYGKIDEQTTVNEIYCCALGDFTNWNQFLGVSTDSWVGSVGSPGEFTGCINYLGYPTFFKEDCIHQVTVSQTGAHRINELPCRGVEKGSEKSLVMINEVLYYKSKFDFCRYSGGVPQGISDELGDAEYKNCVAGGINGRYYVQAKGKEKTLGVDAYHMFVYDTKRGVWLHEDSSFFEPYGFATVGKSLFCAMKYLNEVAPKIYDLCGFVGRDELGPSKWNQHEKNVRWIAQTGALYTEYPDNKYAIRFDLRVEGTVTGYFDGDTHKNVPVIPELVVFVKYSDSAQYRDGSEGWVEKGRYTVEGLKTIIVPVTPHRCDTMMIKLVGYGDIKILSFAKVLEVGSDV